MLNFSREHLQQTDKLLEQLGQELDISKEEYEMAVRSYNEVASWLAAADSPLAPYQPVILPQGSFMLGTMIKGLGDSGTLDIDLVCQLTGKKADWTPFLVKKAVGDRLLAHSTYKALLTIPDGRRCWTLNTPYRNGLIHYHMDILPSIISTGYFLLVEKIALSKATQQDFESVALRITDKQHRTYYNSTRTEEWLKSNPVGYGIWFFQRAELTTEKVSLRAQINPVPAYSTDKLPLQRIVQLLKRHRDSMFEGDEDKPISIIITTLAAKAYQKETNILLGLSNVLERMEGFIEEKYDPLKARRIKWISNPVNEAENFADKWVETPQKQANFYKWLAKAQQDIYQLINQKETASLTRVLESSFRYTIPVNPSTRNSTFNSTTMANVIQDSFEIFHERIKLELEESEPLLEKREMLLNELKTFFKRKSEAEQKPLITFEVINQGSFAIGTGNNPISDECDYDIDVALLFHISIADYQPITVKRWIFEALDQGKRIKEFYLGLFVCRNTTS